MLYKNNINISYPIIKYWYMLSVKISSCTETPLFILFFFLQTIHTYSILVWHFTKMIRDNDTNKQRKQIWMVFTFVVSHFKHYDVEKTSIYSSILEIVWSRWRNENDRNQIHNILWSVRCYLNSLYVCPYKEKKTSKWSLLTS